MKELLEIMKKAYDGDDEAEKIISEILERVSKKMGVYYGGRLV